LSGNKGDKKSSDKSQQSGKGNNEEEAGYQTRKTHSSRNDDTGDNTTAK
jgi:hypothetical protein